MQGKSSSVFISALFIEHLLDNDWMMTTCKCRVSKLMERSRTLMHYIRAAILWVRGSCWKFCRVQAKVVTHWWAIISEAVTLINQNTVYTCFEARKEIAVLCILWHLWIISQPKDCSTWKEPGLVRYCFSGGVVYRQIRWPFWTLSSDVIRLVVI